MYVPRAFEVADQPTLDAFIQDYSFATLFNLVDGKPFATHLPLILDRAKSANGSLLGHVAVANPHWRVLDNQQETLAVFQGPHAYISPNWYTTSQAVPTWNYTAVHVYGSTRLMEESELSSFVDSLTALYEAAASPLDPYRVDPELKAQLLRGIVGFVLDIDRVEGKFKLSQNRSLEDQLGVVKHLDMSRDPIAQALASLTSSRIADGGAPP